MTVTLSLSQQEEQRLRAAAQALGVAPETLVREFVEQGLMGCAPAPSKPVERVLGLHAGKIWVSDDFDDPLPDSFWLGGE